LHFKSASPQAEQLINVEDGSAGGPEGAPILVVVLAVLALVALVGLVAALAFVALVALVLVFILTDQLATTRRIQNQGVATVDARDTRR
jgi:fatty acid desaturase